MSRDGHDVTVFDRVADPRPIGAGILLQSLGQRTLDDLGLRDELAACSRRVRHIDGRTRTGSTVLRFGYEDAPGAIAGLGVHRGDLFRILWLAAERASAAPSNGGKVKVQANLGFLARFPPPERWA